jgi:hypothetical protein
LFAGNVYPRWLPELNSGAGSPVFYFYGPLPFYLTAPFQLVVGPRETVVLGIWLMLGLSGQAFYSFASSFTKTMSAVAASIAYMAMPYHFLVDVWVRSDFGELAAYIMIPLCLLCASRLSVRVSWAFGLAASYSGLLAAHLPSALLFTPFLVATCAYVAWRGNFVDISLKCMFAACLSVALAASYVVPAISYQYMIHADHWSAYRPSQNPLFSHLQIGIDLLLDAIVANSALVIAIYAMILLASGQLLKMIPWLLIATTVIFFVSPLAAGLWDSLPALFDKVQFSWRSLILLDVALCMLFALSLDGRIVSFHAVLGLMLLNVIAASIVFLVLGARGGPAGLMRRSEPYEDFLIQARFQPIEYLPSCLTIQGNEWSAGGPERILARSMKEMTQSQLAVFYYPFLDARSGGNSVFAYCDAKTGFMSVGPHKGPVTVKPRLLPLELASDATSLCSAVIWLIGLFFSTRRPRVSKPKTRMV